MDGGGDVRHIHDGGCGTARTVHVEAGTCHRDVGPVSPNKAHGSIHMGHGCDVSNIPSRDGLGHRHGHHAANALDANDPAVGRSGKADALHMEGRPGVANHVDEARDVGNIPPTGAAGRTINIKGSSREAGIGSRSADKADGTVYVRHGGHVGYRPYRRRLAHADGIHPRDALDRQHSTMGLTRRSHTLDVQPRPLDGSRDMNRCRDVNCRGARASCAVHIKSIAGRRDSSPCLVREEYPAADMGHAADVVDRPHHREDGHARHAEGAVVLIRYAASKVDSSRDMGNNPVVRPLVDHQGIHPRHALNRQNAAMGGSGIAHTLDVDACALNTPGQMKSR